MVVYKLTYFDIRALGEHIRFMFIAAGVPFEDCRIALDDWVNWKSKIKYGQVPVLEIDGKELSQSIAIARFLGSTLNLGNISDPFLIAKADEVVDFLTELRLEFRAWFIEKNDDTKSELGKQLETSFPKYFGILDEIIGSLGSGNFITGNEPSWQDFFMANWANIFEDCFIGHKFTDSYPNVKRIRDSVFAIPAIKEYVSKRGDMVV